MAINGFGFVFGEIFTYGVFAKVTEGLSYEQAFSSASVLIVFLSGIHFLMVKEPIDKNLAL